MVDEDGIPDNPGTRLLKGLAIAVGILALSCLLLFVPVVGAVLLLTAAPFLACYYGVRVAEVDQHRGWLWLGLSAGAIISLVESSILLSIVGLFGPLDVLEPLGLAILAAVFLSNMAFGALGGRRAASG